MPRFLGFVVGALAATVVLAMPAGEALAVHVGCGDVITQDTTLDSDLRDCPGDGILIGADGITLDLDGHTIDGTGGSWALEYCYAGVVSVPRDSFCPRPAGDAHAGVTIRGGTIRDFGSGVLFIGTDRAVLRELELSGSIGGISLSESRQSVIAGNRLSQNRFGILLGHVSDAQIAANVLVGNTHGGIESEGLDRNRFEKNVFYDNEHGMHLHSARDNVVADNLAVDNSSSGLEISDGAHDNRVVRNRVSGNGNGIVIFEGTRRNLVQRNRVSGNGLSWQGPGILVDGETQVVANAVYGNGIGIQVCCNDDTSLIRNRIIANGDGVVVEAGGHDIEENWVSRNTGGGIVLSADLDLRENGNSIQGNRVTRNGKDGIFIGHDAAGTIVGQNVTSRNADDGIHVESIVAMLSRNRADRNGDLGIEAAPGVTDGGKNRAFGNGNPLQCVNVFCR